MKSLLLAAVLAAGLSLPAMAQDNTDPIDAVLTTCLDAPDGQSTAGMIACADAAYASWDKELNAVYAALIENIDADFGGEAQGLAAPMGRVPRFRI